MPFTRKYVKMDEGIDMLRQERRSFWCHNKLWEEILRQNYGIMSISEYVKQAVVEKMIRDEPEKEEYFSSLTKLN